MVTVEVVTEIDAPPERVFDLELDADAHAASQAASGETASTSTGRAALALGDEVTFQARHFGVRWRLTSRVTAFERPARFVDEQVRGPFRSMRHEHLFETRPDGGTRMTDRMQVESLLGGLATRVLLAPYLRRLLQQRAGYIRARAEGG